MELLVDLYNGKRQLRGEEKSFLSSSLGWAVLVKARHGSDVGRLKAVEERGVLWRRGFLWGTLIIHSQYLKSSDWLYPL